MDTPRIKIYTRSMNLALYNRAMFFLDLPYPKVRLTDTTADGYLYQLIQDEEADIIINIDEDAFVFDLERLKSLLNYVIENDYVNCGMPDGGVVHLRRLNPLVTNPYFNILNVKEIRKKFSLKEIQEFPFHKDCYMDIFPKNLLTGGYEFICYEPYYLFFIWMSQNFKTLYINAENHPDGVSTTLCDQNNEPFLIHTWYSRMYNNDRIHTKRINEVVRECEKTYKHKYKPSLKEIIDSNTQFYWNFSKRKLIILKKKIFAIIKS